MFVYLYRRRLDFLRARPLAAYRGRHHNVYKIICMITIICARACGMKCESRIPENYSAVVLQKRVYNIGQYYNKHTASNI